jgi:hypothetical protein
MFEESNATNLTDMREDYLLKMNEYRVKSSENDYRTFISNYSGENIPYSSIVLKDIPKGGEILRAYGVPG